MSSSTKYNAVRTLLLVILCRVVKPDLIVKPNDAEALVGGSTFFNCSTSLTSTEIHWFHYATGTTQDRSFVYGYGQFYSSFTGRCQMEKNDATGAYNLVISSVTIEDAGRYECQDDAGRGDKDSAELTVLDGNPVCQSNMKPEGLIGPNMCGLEPEELHLSCVVVYRGNQPPIMEWKEAGSVTPIKEGVTRNVSADRAICYLSLEVDHRIDGSSYQCETTRSATSQYSCTSDVVNVKGDNRLFLVIGCVLGAIIFIMAIFILVCFIVGRRKMKQTGRQSRSNAREQIELIETQDKEAMLDMRKENERLTAKIKELEQFIYSADNERLKTKSKLVHTIVTKAFETKSAPITGIAIVENGLFVVSKNFPDIEVYDSKTFVFKRLIENTPLENPVDIASSEKEKCLYIISRKDNELKSKIIKLDIDGGGGKVWATENDDGRLSVYESHLIVCFSTKRIIQEYSPEGKFENTVRLSPGAGFHQLWHAIKLTGLNFAVSHSKVDGQQRVCVVDISGSVLMAFEKLPKLNIKLLRMNVPILGLYLAEVRRDKSILVADTMTSRVLLLSSNLKVETVFIETDRSQLPVRLCLDDTNDRVFVGVNKSETWNNGRVLIYNITKK